jgi:uncharacterized protein with GYD domain
MTMAAYLMLFRFTEKGMENIKESPARVEAAKQTISRMGGEFKTFYGMVGGDFDTMFIIHAPNDVAVAKMVLAIDVLGNVRTQSHRLFSEDEFKTVISSST